MLSVIECGIVQRPIKREMRSCEPSSEERKMCSGTRIITLRASRRFPLRGTPDAFPYHIRNPGCFVWSMRQSPFIFGTFFFFSLNFLHGLRRAFLYFFCFPEREVVIEGRQDSCFFSPRLRVGGGCRLCESAGSSWVPSRKRVSAFRSPALRERERGYG